MVAHQEVLRRSRDEPDGLLDSDTELFIVSLSGEGPLQLVTRCRASETQSAGREGAVAKLMIRHNPDMVPKSEREPGFAWVRHLDANVSSSSSRMMTTPS
jgi:hypothetical protein